MTGRARKNCGQQIRVFYSSTSALAVSSSALMTVQTQKELRAFELQVANR
jgi:hypothetical protein